jgi:hypothetical protein
MVDQQSDYLNLLDQMAGIDPHEGLAKELAGLAEASIRRDDTLELLLLAEQAAHAQQWQAAAQLFSLMMVSSFDQRFTETYLLEHAKCITLLTGKHPADLRSATDLLLYGHRRLTASLHRDGMRQPHLGEWMVAAFNQLLRAPKSRTAAAHAAVAELHPRNNRITKRYQSEIGPLRRLLTCSLHPRANDVARVSVSAQGRRLSLGLLGVALIAIALMAYRFGPSFPLPVSSLLDRYLLGGWLRAALIAWPLLLLATWLFALFESYRTRTFYFISPRHLFYPETITAGEIKGFSDDWFFHIFQFVWIALLVIAWLLFVEYQGLPGWLPSVWNQNSLRTFLDSQTVRFLYHAPFEGGFWSYVRAFFGSDLVALALAIAACAYSIYRQRRIQNERKSTGKDLYWWDRRINPTEWRIRLIMVGVDLFLVTFLLAKILMILFVAYELAVSKALMVSYLSPDGVGGLKDLTDWLTYLSWFVLLFGMFVFASLYLHWNLREYRRNDLALVVSYALLVVLTVAPLLILDSRLSAEKDARLQQLATAANQPSANLEEVGKYVRNVNSVRDWPVSAVKVAATGKLLPLTFQFLVILYQFFGQDLKLPKLPLPGLSGESASKGPHDAH